MATLLTQAGPATLPIGAGSLTFRRATSMDRDVAHETAAAWFTQILDAQPITQDFGLADISLEDVVARVMSGERDVRAFGTALFAVALALQVKPTVTDLLRQDADDADPRPLRADRADIAWLFREKSIQDQFLDLALSDVYRLDTLGKPSGVGSDTNSAPAP
jgi:hypothetical protein